MPQIGRSTLGRKKAPRKALLMQATNSLIRHKRIITTKAKAKMIARYIAPIITQARRQQPQDPRHTKQQTFSALRNKKNTQVLLKEILPQIGQRPGGYTRIIALPRRPGDAAPTALLELVDYNTRYNSPKSKAPRKSTPQDPPQTEPSKEPVPPAPAPSPQKKNQPNPQEKPASQQS